MLKTLKNSTKMKNNLSKNRLQLINRTNNKIIKTKSNSNIQNLIARKMKKVVNKIRIIAQIKNNRVVSKYMRMSRLLPITTMLKEF